MLKKFIKSIPFLHKTSIALRTIAHKIFQSFVFILAAFHFVIFIIANRKIFKNNVIFPFWQWSFGHSFTLLDYATRLYYPHRISLIYIPHVRSNGYLPQLFSDTVDVFSPKLFSQTHLVGESYYKCFEFFISLICNFYKHKFMISLYSVYKTVSLAPNKIKTYDHKKSAIVNADEYSGYIRLLSDGVGSAPYLPDELIKAAKNSIIASFPDFFAKPFVTLLLRRKGINSAWDDSSRCVGRFENYLPAVEYLIQQGFNVVGTGEIDHDVFKHLPGYFCLDSVEASPKLVNLFLLTQAALVITQQSGPHTVPNSCGVPCLITDALPYRLGTFNPADLILFKKYKRADGSYLSLTDIFQENDFLLFGKQPDKNITVEFNTAVEIVAAVAETLLLMHKKFVPTQEEAELIDAYYKLVPSSTTLYYQKNRMPLFVLHQNADQLLKYSVDAC